MNKTKKLLSLLAGLDEDVTVCDVTETRLNNGDIRIDIPVTHKIHIRPCDECGSKDVKKCGVQLFHASHIPQGKRRPSRLICRKQRFKCKACGATFMEKIPWLYKNAHMTVPLADCIIEDPKTLMTKNGIARTNRVSVHYNDLESEVTFPIYIKAYIRKNGEPSYTLNIQKTDISQGEHF